MAGKIILNLAVSLDGYIADEHGGYDWIKGSGNPQLNTADRWDHGKFLAGVSAVIMGRACYDQGFHEDFRDKPVYVITSRETADHGSVRFISGDIPEKIEEIRKQGSGDVYLFGGGVSIDPLLKAGIIDEYIIGIIPVILGSGRPLFLGGSRVIPLTMTHYYIEDGIVILRYEPRRPE
ncbi:dihydrofolate reductase family protein [Breznakiella homolactica]|uniref:Dihydrofolate reductase family protein n=1 Tax=Breznakiella homolactica TaxID=2798577 RepID=A0A7T7XMN8_9SPIR|nr:dihydrofolate reductase family protein [Breznakiella homolactica]QQO09181.1 dihydrofolate reductase family protein [Breznakiella homolactica]